MKHALVRLALIAVAAAAVAVPVASAAQTAGRAKPARHVVFVQTNELTGNRIAVYDRAANGLLSRAGTYATGGNGGAAAGASSDKLASQGSLAYDAGSAALIAVNAGSNTVSLLRVQDDRLTLEDVVASGGDFPTSVAVRPDGLVYVLNAGGTGIVQGFRLHGGKLHPIHGSARSLGLANTSPPNFLTSPGQVGFTPDGRQLIATTKASDSMIDVFAVRPDGRLSNAPISNPAATPVPFAFTFDPSSGRLVDGEAGTSSVTTYLLHADGTLSDPRSQTDNQTALCWITRSGGFYYVSNTGSNTVSAFEIAANGDPSLATPTGVVANTGAGPIDSAASGDDFLYVEAGAAGVVDEYRVDADGTLSQIGTATDLQPGIEGIAAN